MCPDKIIKFLPLHPVPGAYPYTAATPPMCNMMARATKDSLTAYPKNNKN